MCVLPATLPHDWRAQNAKSPMLIEVAARLCLRKAILSTLRSVQARIGGEATRVCVDLIFNEEMSSTNRGGGRFFRLAFGVSV